jgi:uncharacterized protein YbbK (DUF523 family)
MERILVSACLLGSRVRYDGRAKRVDAELLTHWRAEGRLVPCCPEVSGGLAVPRPPAEIVGSGDSDGGAVLDGSAQVRTGSGEDVTEFFLRGARLALETARRSDAQLAILKEGSPSCGSHRIYDGTFSETSIPGVGVTTTLLERVGIRVFSEDDLPAAAAYLSTLETV